MKKNLVISGLAVVALLTVALVYNTWDTITAPTRQSGVEDVERSLQELRDVIEAAESKKAE
jgi:hypothetical protein